MIVAATMGPKPREIASDLSSSLVSLSGGRRRREPRRVAAGFVSTVRAGAYSGPAGLATGKSSIGGPRCGEGIRKRAEVETLRRNWGCVYATAPAT